MIKYIAMKSCSYCILKTHSLYEFEFSVDVRDVSARSSYKLSTPFEADSWSKSHFDIVTAKVESKLMLIVSQSSNIIYLEQRPHLDQLIPISLGQNVV